MKIEQIAEEALALPSDERALLADRLVESLDPADGGSIRQLWTAEARRRLDEVRSGRVKTIPGDEALARVRAARQTLNHAVEKWERDRLDRLQSASRRLAQGRRDSLFSDP